MDRHPLNVEELQNTKSRLKRGILQAGWSPYNIIGCISNSHTDKTSIRKFKSDYLS